MALEDVEEHFDGVKGRDAPDDELDRDEQGQVLSPDRIEDARVLQQDGDFDADVDGVEEDDDVVGPLNQSEQRMEGVSWMYF